MHYAPISIQVYSLSAIFFTESLKILTCSINARNIVCEFTEINQSSVEAISQLIFLCCAKIHSSFVRRCVFSAKASAWVIANLIVRALFYKWARIVFLQERLASAGKTNLCKWNRWLDWIFRSQWAHFRISNFFFFFVTPLLSLPAAFIILFWSSRNAIKTERVYRSI